MLVLSLFPGIDLLGRAFEIEMPDACLVRGPDLLWGGDVRRFSAPTGVFDGIIGGPPCQVFSRLGAMNAHAGQKHGNMIPEFERVVSEAHPRWFVMENVPDAPLPVVDGYQVRAVLLNNRWVDDGDTGPDQNRVRRFSFGTPEGLSLESYLDFALFQSPRWEGAVLAGHGPAMGQRVRGITDRAPAEMARLQGLPADFLADAPFTVHGKKRVIGNGVPLPLGRAIARAVRRALAAPTGDRCGDRCGE